MTALREPRRGQGSSAPLLLSGSGHHITRARVFCDPRHPPHLSAPEEQPLVDVAFAYLLVRAGRKSVLGGLGRPCSSIPGLWALWDASSLPAGAEGSGCTNPGVPRGPCQCIALGCRAAEHRLFLSVFHKHQNTSSPINSSFLVSKAATLASSCFELDFREIFC